MCLHSWDYSKFLIKIETKMKNRSHRYDINRPRSRNEHKESKYKKCLTMMILICIKQHLSNIWSSIHEKVKQHWGWIEKKRFLQKKLVILIGMKSKVPSTWMIWRNYDHKQDCSISPLYCICYNPRNITFTSLYHLSTQFSCRLS